MSASASDLERLVTVSVDGAIATVTLNRPEKRNALSEGVIARLRDIFSSLGEEVRVVILNAAGDHFSAGLDLSELKTRTAAEGVMHSRSWYEAFARVQFGKVPVVCVLHGAVVGGGLELASSAHVRVAEENAYFGLPEGQRGIFVGGGGSVRLPKLIGFSRVTEMMLTGRVYSAAEALAIGLAHYVTPAGEGMRKARALAERIAGNAPLTNFAIMHTLPLIAEQTMEHGLMTEALVSSIAASDGEARSRVTAFLEKRADKIGPAGREE